MAAQYKNGKRKRNGKLPIFDPNPSGRFVHEVLKQTSVRGILIGRLAVWVWLSEDKKHSFTKDMDIAVTREGLHRIRKWLNERQIKYLELEIGGINVDRPNQINVDFITRYCAFGDFSPLFEDAINFATEHGETIEVGEDELFVMSPEHLVAMKIGTGEKKDEDDAEALLGDADIHIDNTRSLILKFLGPGSLSRFEVMLRKIGHPSAKSVYKDS
ncbi:hypothetical protein QUF72_02340 [Desulfobacterales bacterium HSG2]|nr:hypothetical protein [Desulfobacterales bacterium HSG2]